LRFLLEPPLIFLPTGAVRDDGGISAGLAATAMTFPIPAFVL
jgi:hypothetical protein